MHILYLSTLIFSLHKLLAIPSNLDMIVYEVPPKSLRIQDNGWRDLEKAQGKKGSKAKKMALSLRGYP